MHSSTFIGSLELLPHQLRQHVLVLGSSGSGKSTLLRALFSQHANRGDGILFVDPHGDDALAALDLIPRSRSNQVCYLDVGDPDTFVGIDLGFHVQDPNERALRVQLLVHAMHGIWADSWGPRLEAILRNSLAALMYCPGATLVMLPEFLTESSFRRSVLAEVDDPVISGFFRGEFDAWPTRDRETFVQPVLNKTGAFLFSPIVRRMLGDSKGKLSFEHALATKKIVVCNLAKGAIGAEPARLLGALILACVQAAAMARYKIKPELRHDFHVLVDEVASFGGASFIKEMLEELRKQNVSMTLASQMLAALHPDLREAVLTNCQTVVAYRISPTDADVLAPHLGRLQQDFNPARFGDLDRGECIVRRFGDDAHYMQMGPPPVGRGTAATIIKQSKRHYSRAAS